MHYLFGSLPARPTRAHSKSFSRSSSRSSQYSAPARTASGLEAFDSIKHTNNDRHSDERMTSEEVDCFRSMRGTSTDTLGSIESAMSADINELNDRLRSVRQSADRRKKVFDSQGQAYHVLVTHDEVRICHIDDKGEYHYRHIPTHRASAANSAAVSSAVSRRTSAGVADNKNEAKADPKTGRPTGLKRDRLSGFRELVNKSKAIRSLSQSQTEQPTVRRSQIIRDSLGEKLVDIRPDTVTVYHNQGVWRCHRFAGKIWDSDYSKHLTARMPRPWHKLTRREHYDDAYDSSVGSDVEDAEANAGKKQDNAVELLLCSNTPGERGTAPKAFKSFYHDL